MYPIKVNQQRHVVEEIVEFGKTHGVGLECGIASRSCRRCSASPSSTEHLIVCNGYKDEEFMRLALMGQKLGHQVFIVLEQLSELDVLLEVADELGVTPTAGVRIKLASEGSGRWAQSGGEKSKFGLNAAQLDEARSTGCAREGRLDILKLIHFHLGSRRSPTSATSRPGCRRSRASTPSCARSGVDITHVDVGGGLGVDYDGTNSTSHASVNYSLQEYANDVVYTIAEACREHELPMPHIISESGRALTAHHALLLLKVIDVESQADAAAARARRTTTTRCCTRWSRTTRRSSKNSMRREGARGLPRRDVRQGARAAAVQQRRALAARARDGRADLLRDDEPRSRASRSSDRDEYEDIIEELDATLVDRYFCNFSLFQSLPDSWAIDQLFPIMPIHRLDEEPTRRGTLQDVTCDSDGKIDRFVGDKDGQPESRAARRSATASRTSSASSSPARTRRSSATCTTCSATRTRCTSGSSDNGLRDHRSRARRHGDRGAELRAVPRVRPARDVPAQGRRGEGHHAAGSEHVHRRVRRGARGLHVPRG